jgi:hypothetical protein
LGYNKEKGINCKKTSKVEGYFYEFWKTWGVFRKTAKAGGGVDLFDRSG